MARVTQTNVFENELTNRRVFSHIRACRYPQVRRSLQDEGRSCRKALSRTFRSRLRTSKYVSFCFIKFAGDGQGHVLPFRQFLSYKLDALHDAACSQNRARLHQAFDRQEVECLHHW